MQGYCDRKNCKSKMFFIESICMMNFQLIFLLRKNTETFDSSMQMCATVLTAIRNVKPNLL